MPVKCWHQLDLENYSLLHPIAVAVLIKVLPITIAGTRKILIELHFFLYRNYSLLHPIAVAVLIKVLPITIAGTRKIQYQNTVKKPTQTSNSLVRLHNASCVSCMERIEDWEDSDSMNSLGLDSEKENRFTSIEVHGRRELPHG